MRSFPIGWTRALELELQDRLKEAEDLLDNCAQIAELYAERMRRFARQGHISRALDAFRESERWMESHAGDGEAAAWNYEKMLHRETLVRELGFDPLWQAERICLG